MHVTHLQLSFYLVQVVCSEQERVPTRVKREAMEHAKRYLEVGGGKWRDSALLGNAGCRFKELLEGHGGGGEIERNRTR